MVGLVLSMFLGLAWLAAAAPAGAQARLNRCLDAAGYSVFTDRSCQELGATPWRADPSSDRRAIPHGCARDWRELQERLQQALALSDTNALAAHYHWPGTHRRRAAAVMARLQRLAEEAAVARIDPGPRDQAGVRFLAPAGSRLESARFGLARHAGCWWIVD